MQLTVSFSYIFSSCFLAATILSPSTPERCCTPVHCRQMEWWLAGGDYAASSSCPQMWNENYEWSSKNEARYCPVLGRFIYFSAEKTGTKWVQSGPFFNWFQNKCTFLSLTLRSIVAQAHCKQRRPMPLNPYSSRCD